MAQILIVDDEPSMQEFMQILLEKEGHEVVTASDVKSAIEICRRDAPDLVYSDLRLPDGSGMEILRFVREASPASQVIMLTAFGTTENAVEAMRLGAYDYQIKPLRVAEVRLLTQKALEKAQLIRENRQLSDQLQRRFGLSRFVGRSRKMAEVVELVEKVAPSRANVLIEGESGTGKELVARAIHDGSPRARQAFIAVNCGAIPETLIEAELFGHVAGAFTGAAKSRPGLFEAGHGGSVFLDEIGELPPQMQVKLLRVIQERSVRRVGDDAERPVDVRVIAATNRDLERMAREGKFREDLFYRLNVVRIRVPPLRERSEDIPLLAKAFLLKFAPESGKEIHGITEEALRLLVAFPFPGNVRELENYVERAVALASGDMITPAELPAELAGAILTGEHDLLAFPDGGIDLEKRLEVFERRFIGEALARAKGRKMRAAELLGLSFRSFRYRLQKLGLAGKDDEP